MYPVPIIKYYLYYNNIVLWIINQIYRTYQFLCLDWTVFVVIGTELFKNIPGCVIVVRFVWTFYNIFAHRNRPYFAGVVVTTNRDRPADHGGHSALLTRTTSFSNDGEFPRSSNTVPGDTITTVRQGGGEYEPSPTPPNGERENHTSNAPVLLSRTVTVAPWRRRCCCRYTLSIRATTCLR